MYFDPPPRPQEITKAKPVDDFMAITLDYVRSQCLFLSDRKYYISDAWVKEARLGCPTASCSRPGALRRFKALDSARFFGSLTSRRACVVSLCCSHRCASRT